MLVPSLVFLLLGAAATFAVIIGFRFASKKLSSVVERDPTRVRAEIKNCESVIEQTFSRIDGLISNDRLVEINVKVNSVKSEIEAAQKEASRLQAEVDTLQAEVGGKEGVYLELRKSHEQTAELAKALEDEKAQASAELARLEGQLADSKMQMSLLAEEVELTREQEDTLAEIAMSLSKLTDQMNEVAAVYEQTSKNFLTLETQYKELEKEYRRLIERELSEAANA